MIFFDEFFKLGFEGKLSDQSVFKKENLEEFSLQNALYFYLLKENNKLSEKHCELISTENKLIKNRIKKEMYFKVLGKIQKKYTGKGKEFLKNFTELSLHIKLLVFEWTKIKENIRNGQEYFEIENGSQDDVKRKYNELVKRYHPDMISGDHKFQEKFQEVQENYDKLRKSYKERKKLVDDCFKILDQGEK